ncbi:MAG: hypothetical protein J6S04_03290 [Clostridia bacterium]|nr:hypothetical protein [Clostridia bacterium]
MDKQTPKNLILLCGELLNDGTDCLCINGEEYVQFSIKINLTTGVDILPVWIKKARLDETVKKGSVLSLTGRLLSEEKFENGESRLSLAVLAEEIYDGETEITSGIFLTGSVLQTPHVYTLQNSLRAEWRLSVETEGGGVLVVPMVANAENANIAAQLSLGDTLSLLGQLHSYQWMDFSGEVSAYTAYEVEVLTYISLPEL